MKNGNGHRRLNVLTWHIHGSYLYYLLHTPHNFILPVKPHRGEGYGGLPKGPSFNWSENAREVPAEEIKNTPIDVILYQSRKNYLEDQFEILSEEQLSLPRLYLEHDPPRETPTDTRHIVDDPNTLLVHVTHFNDLMWDSGQTPTRVIEHGVVISPGIRYSGELERGLVVVNGLKKRGRRLGVDLFETARRQVPLDLVGIDADQMDGLGEVSHTELPAFEARYRFFFNPIRYTSLGLAVCEAMMVGLPVIGMATTEMVTTIENGVSGYVDTDLGRLVDCMKELLHDPAEARRLGNGAQRTAQERFNIQRFAADWSEAIQEVALSGRTPQIIPAREQVEAA